MYKRLDSNYEVSSEGEVRNIKTGNVLKGKYKGGYKYVNLSYGGIKKTCQVHRLVATVFIPNPNNYPVINHKDENPSNNNVENLEWCTQSYNLSYGSKIRKELMTKRLLGSVNAPKKVIQLNKDKEVINIFESAQAASRSTGIASTHILDCCNKKICKDSKGYTYFSKSAGGYLWEFQESNH